MANLIVRNLDPAIVTALKRRATQHGRSAEAEHRILLETALLHPPRRSLAEALAEPYPMWAGMRISSVLTTAAATPVYLVDTNVISELRKGGQANAGVRRFFRQAIADASPVFLSVITVGELRRGVESIRHRGDGRHCLDS